MNKFVKGALITYGVIVAAKTVEFVIANKRIAKASTEVVHGYEVVRDTGLLKIHGIRVAAVLVFTDGIARIVVDKHFFNLSEMTQKAILAHENGHIALGHLYRVNSLNREKRALQCLLGGVQDIELEADAYAAEKVGTEEMVAALTELLTLKGINKVELHRRIAALA